MAQTSKSAVSRVSKPAANREGAELEIDDAADLEVGDTADLEVGDTADLEVCATTEITHHASRTTLPPSKFGMTIPGPRRMVPAESHTLCEKNERKF